jgi:hypothetical protein
VVRRARLVLLLCALASALAISYLPQLRADNSIESFLLEDDPALTLYDEFREAFDRDDRIVVGLDAPSVYDVGVLERLRALHQDLETRVPHLEEVTSLVNARSTQGRGDQLVIEDLLEIWPRKPSDLKRLRSQVENTPLYRNLLVSQDGGFTTLVLKPNTFSSFDDVGTELGGFDDEPRAGGPAGPQERSYLSDAETVEMVHALREVVARHRSEDLPIYVVGGPFMNVSLTEAMQSDVTLFIGHLRRGAPARDHLPPPRGGRQPRGRHRGGSATFRARHPHDEPHHGGRPLLLRPGRDATGETSSGDWSP